VHFFAAFVFLPPVK